MEKKLFILDTIQYQFNLLKGEKQFLVGKG
jgi:hypothetical protein